MQSLIPIRLHPSLVLCIYKTLVLEIYNFGSWPTAGGAWELAYDVGSKESDLNGIR